MHEPNEFVPDDIEVLVDVAQPARVTVSQTESIGQMRSAEELES